MQSQCFKTKIIGIIILFILPLQALASFGKNDKQITLACVLIPVFKVKQPISISLNIAQGYNGLINNAHAYELSHQDLSARLGIAINTNDFIYRGKPRR